MAYSLFSHISNRWANQKKVFEALSADQLIKYKFQAQTLKSWRVLVDVLAAKI